nr:PREDICTED: putative syntaxin-2 [Bemisia tabaci]XP_018917719.1 PREDICTED: putative syntaxin-2 [Bemisia tabaci]XP_018917720.1 PREDICTED: putative syntaxin-2 [Bemisia tabaci]
MSQKRYGTMDSRMSSSMGSPQPGASDRQSKELAESITTNMYTINNGSRTLDQALKIIGTPRDNQAVRDKWHVTQMSVNQIIAQMSKDLQKFSALSRSGDKAQKLQSEKLVNNFKETVQTYSDLQNQVAQKMKSNPLPTVLTMEEENKLNFEAVESDQRQLIAQKQLQNELEFEQSLLLERETRMRQIEGDIIDVNVIMRELGAITRQQNENINSIEGAVESIYDNIERGTEELRKGAEYQVRRRKKNCCLLTVVATTFVVLIIIFWQFSR